MASLARNLGVLRPLGGGDPIPLLKEELIVGRRPTADIRLDFENVSGKHCVLKFIRGVWHIRDLNSTNGTFLNRQRVEHDHGVMPDDELRVATHMFAIDYEPIAPTSLVDANLVLEDEIAQAARSLTELAGIEVESEGRHSRMARGRKMAAAAEEKERKARAEETEPPALGDSIPEDFAPLKPDKLPSDDEFLKLIGDELP